MPNATPPLASDERWVIVQVASFLSISYQTARNNMLAGDFGPSDYDAETRRLTVSAERVRAMKPKGKTKKKKRSKKANAHRED